MELMIFHIACQNYGSQSKLEPILEIKVIQNYRNKKGSLLTFVLHIKYSFSKMAFSIGFI